MRYIVVAVIFFTFPLLLTSWLYALDHLCGRCD
jgi:hypothetical protein